MGSTAKRVLVVRHPEDPFNKTAYIVHLLIEEWRRRGIPVDVTTRPDGPIDDGVLVIPHLDVTVTPAEYCEFFRRCPMVLNRAVADISKRRISRNLVTSASAHDGAVIVKTDRNAGGAPETQRVRRKGGMRGGMRRAILNAARRLPWTVTGLLGPHEYKIYDHPRLVPRAVWHNRRLVVEKFLPERVGDLYCLRQYVFLGTREVNTLALSPEPLVKAQNVVRREVLPDTPAALRELRRQLGFDYGKFDYVMLDGEVVLFDANRTPTYNADSKAGSARPLIVNLASGIDDLLGLRAGTTTIPIAAATCA